MVLVPVLLEYGVLDDGLLVVGEHVGVDHVVEHELGDLVEVVGRHVEADGAVQQHGAQLEQRVERERGHVGLGPAVAALLHVLLEFYPSGKKVKLRSLGMESRPSNRETGSGLELGAGVPQTVFRRP